MKNLKITKPMEESDPMYSESRMFRKQFLWISVPVFIASISGLFPEQAQTITIMVRVVGVIASIPIFVSIIPHRYFGIKYVFGSRTEILTRKNINEFEWRFRWPWESIMLISQEAFSVSISRESPVLEGYFFRADLIARACPDFHGNGMHPVVESRFWELLEHKTEWALREAISICQKLDSNFLSSHTNAIQLCALCLVKLACPPHQNRADRSPEELVLFYENNHEHILNKFDLHFESKNIRANHRSPHYKGHETREKLLQNVLIFPDCISEFERFNGIEVLALRLEVGKSRPK